MKSSDQALAQALKQKLMDEGIPLHSLYVFGSRARGDAKEESDLDVLVVVRKRDWSIKEQIRRCAWEIGFEPGILIQCIIVTQDEMENSPWLFSPVLETVEREGIPV